MANEMNASQALPLLENQGITKVCKVCFYKLPEDEFRRIQAGKPKLRDNCRTCESWSRVKMRSKICSRCNKNKPLTAYDPYVNIKGIQTLTKPCLACHREDFRKQIKRKRFTEIRNLSQFEKCINR